jgi:HSP20 family protein
MPVISHRNGSSHSGSDHSNEKENHYTHHPRYGHHHEQVDHYHRNPHNSFFPGFADEFFHHSPFSGSFDERMPVLNNLDRGEDYTIHHSSPGYEINETTVDYQIAIDVPGVHLADLSLQLENYGHVLHVQGKRQIHRDGKVSQTKFEKRYRIGHNIDHESITAHLSEGVLVVTAPKLRELKKKPKHISIREGENP